MKRIAQEARRRQEAAIRAAFSKRYLRYGWDGVYAELREAYGYYTRSFGGMYRAAARLGLGWQKGRKRLSRKARR